MLNNIRKITIRIAEYGSDRRAAISPMMVFMLIPLCGIMSLAGEVSFWFMTQRALQNAADSSALAAAANNDATNTDTTSGGATWARYKTEAFTVAKTYGFENGVNGVQVIPENGVSCPDGSGNDCYRVTLLRNVPLYLTQMVGYGGDPEAASGDRLGKRVAATAIAKPRARTEQYCMIGLNSSGDSIRINGGPNVDLAGCDLKSNANLVCNGSQSDTGVVYGDAVGSSGCGSTRRSGQAATPDPFNYLNANPPIPTRTCSTYSVTTVTDTSLFSNPFCGGVKIGNNIDITTANTVLTINNGSLDLNGKTLKTSGDGSLTIIFTAPTSTTGGSTTYHHYPVGSGTLDITAPSSGTFKGVAMMQDKRLTGNRNDVDMTHTGSSPTLNITGLVYFPRGSFTIKGAINHKTGGKSCIGVIAGSILISGQGAIFDNPTQDCHLLGLELPGIPGTEDRQSLVQ